MDLWKRMCTHIPTNKYVNVIAGVYVDTILCNSNNLPYFSFIFPFSTDIFIFLSWSSYLSLPTWEFVKCTFLTDQICFEKYPILYHGKHVLHTGSG